MKYRLTLLLAAFCFATAAPTFAQTTDEDSTQAEATEQEPALKPAPKHPHYFSNALDAGILQSSVFERPGMDKGFTYLRFTFGVNIGVNFNYDFDEHFGIYTGLGIKNIGFTDKISDSTVKRRVYTIGAPLGFKFGNLSARTFVFVGGGIDVPFNYREKGWVDRKNKTKFSEWFSDRTPDVMPYIFAGFSMKPGLTLKAQLYTSNFFNTSFQEDAPAGTVARKPYQGYDARLVIVSLGFDIHYRQSEKPMNTPQ